MRKSFLAVLIVILFIFTGCSNERKEESENKTIKIAEHEQGVKIKKFQVTIDWAPSPEYYGFFYAKSQGYFLDYQLDVDIQYGSGAPVVASQLAAGDIYAGTTTSDNILRQISRGAYFSSAVPLLKFNPSVIASLTSNPINTLMDIKGKTLGTNKQASVYQQLIFLVNNGNIAKNSFKEYPIGWGGAAQLENGLVDGILAYTTNAVVDLQTKDIQIKEIYLGKEGIITYGLVLVIGDKDNLNKNNISDSDINNFIAAVKKGYAEGGKDVKNAVASLMAVEPTLDSKKLQLAIDKINKLNSEANYPLESIDQWVTSDDITPEHRKNALSLYK
jgi:ABC-type nitrate/sulfonate/bicarbonate transport system substrate-binding protein